MAASRSSAAAAAAIGAVANLIAPPRCPACRRPGPLPDSAGVCGRCLALFANQVPRALALPRCGTALAPLPYVPPVTGLVAALKSGRVPAAAASAAELIAEGLPPLPPATVLVPVGAAPLRRLRRGLDPAAEIAAALAGMLGCECRPGLLRRRDGRPQRGRSRAERLAAPPRFELAGEPPPLVLLVDDVVTTGATLSSCAAALSGVGAGLVGAVALAWAPERGERVNDLTRPA